MEDACQLQKQGHRLSVFNRIYHMLDEKSLTAYFNGLVLPHLDYADVVWVDQPGLTTQMKQLQSFQNRVAKKISKGKMTSAEALTSLQWQRSHPWSREVREVPRKFPVQVHQLSYWCQHTWLGVAKLISDKWELGLHAQTKCIVCAHPHPRMKLWLPSPAVLQHVSRAAEDGCGLLLVQMRVRLLPAQYPPLVCRIWCHMFCRAPCWQAPLDLGASSSSR